MGAITVSEEKLDTIIADFEVLIEDIASIVDQDMIAKKRLADIKKNPSLGKSEKYLYNYLRNRGVKVG